MFEPTLLIVSLNAWPLVMAGSRRRKHWANNSLAQGALLIAIVRIVFLLA